MENDRVAGHLEVGLTLENQVCINHPDVRPDVNGVGHIIFSPRQARALAASLIKFAAEADAVSLCEAPWRKRKANGAND